MNSSCGRIAVIKLGGSVLVSEQSYREAAQFLLRRLQTGLVDRFVAVVSARKGLTDELERLACDTTPYPNPRTLDLLWSTGEMYSVALLTLHLEQLGVSAVGLNIHETGIRIDRRDQIRVVRAGMLRLLNDHWVVIVPGFSAQMWEVQSAPSDATVRT